MSTIKSGTNLAIQLYGISPLKDLVSQAPVDANMVAVSKNKFASIFYKNDLGHFSADYCNGRGWEAVRQATKKELEHDLKAISFILIELDDLKNTLDGVEDISIGDMPLAKVINGKIETQISRVSLRRDADEDDSYWRGQLDAYDIVQNVIRQYL